LNARVIVISCVRLDSQHSGPHIVVAEAEVGETYLGNIVLESI